VSASADGFPNTLEVLHGYTRSESNDPGQSDTILPIFDDMYTVTLPTDQKLYLNAYDVDLVGSQRIGALSLDLETMRSFADCGRLGNVTGLEMLMGVALTVKSLPEATEG
jgi:hypothetical protein